MGTSSIGRAPRGGSSGREKRSRKPFVWPDPDGIGTMGVWHAVRRNRLVGPLPAAPGAPGPEPYRLRPHAPIRPRGHAMQGLMMDFPLTINHIFGRAERYHRAKTILTVTKKSPETT